MTNFPILISYSLFYVSLILFYFLSIFPSLFFFPFFLIHTHTLNFFFLYFLLSSFSLPLPPHTCPYFFFFISLFFPSTSHSTPLHSTPLQNVPHTSNPSLIPQAGSRSLHLFFFFLTLRKQPNSSRHSFVPKFDERTRGL